MKGPSMRLACGLALAAAILAPAMPNAVCAANQIPHYKLVASIALGAPERWDYASFDPVSKRVYVAHGDYLSVVDTIRNVVAGKVGPFPGGTHGSVALSDLQVAYTDDGEAGTAQAFDPTSLHVRKQIPAAPDADGIVYDPASRHVFVINGDSGSITVIDPRTDTAVNTIKVGAGLEAAIPDGKGKLFVDGVEQHDIVSIDTKTNRVLAHYAMPECERPHGIAIDAETRRVFATCANKRMIVVDADKGTNIAALPIGASSDGAVFDPIHKYAISSNGEGTLSIVKEVDATHFLKLADVPTQRSARTIAIDPSTGRIFLPAAEVLKIAPLDTPGGRPHVTYRPGSLKLLEFDVSNN